MHRTHFGRKKMSQNRTKFTPRITYNFKKPKNHCLYWSKHKKPRRSKRSIAEKKMREIRFRKKGKYEAD